MKKQYKNLEFTLSYYQYDKARTDAYMVVIDQKGNNHTYYKIPLTEEQKSKVWTLATTRGKEEGRAEVKRIFRQLLKRLDVCYSYPFKLDNGDNISIKENYVPINAPIKNKLNVAKRNKNAMVLDNWIYNEPIKTGKVEIVDNKIKVVEDGKEYKREILKDSQFCHRVYYKSFWDVIRTQSKENNKKKQQRIQFLKDSIKVFADIMSDKSKIPQTKYPFEYIDGCKTWEEDYKRRLSNYRKELKVLTS